MRVGGSISSAGNESVAIDGGLCAAGRCAAGLAAACGLAAGLLVSGELAEALLEAMAAAVASSVCPSASKSAEIAALGLRKLAAPLACRLTIEWPVASAMLATSNTETQANNLYILMFKN